MKNKIYSKQDTFIESSSEYLIFHIIYIYSFRFLLFLLNYYWAFKNFKLLEKTWTLTKRPEKKLDGNYTRMLRAILNKSWRQHPTTHQLYGHLPPITKTIQVRRTRHAGHCWRSRDELISDVLYGPPHMTVQKQDDQHEHTFSSYVRIRDVVRKTCLGRWTIGKSGERGSGISVLPARHDDDDIYIYIYIYILQKRHFRSYKSLH